MHGIGSQWPNTDMVDINSQAESCCHLHPLVAGHNQLPVTIRRPSLAVRSCQGFLCRFFPQPAASTYGFRCPPLQLNSCSSRRTISKPTMESSDASATSPSVLEVHFHAIYNAEPLYGYAWPSAIDLGVITVYCKSSATAAIPLSGSREMRGSSDSLPSKSARLTRVSVSPGSYPN